MALSIIPFKTMREIVKLECEGRQGWNEGSASAQEYFIDNMTKVRVEQYKSVDDKIEALLNKIVFPEEMIKEALKPKKKKKKFNVKGRDWVWCCGNKIPKDMEAVGCSVCF